MPPVVGKRLPSRQGGGGGRTEGPGGDEGAEDSAQGLRGPYQGNTGPGVHQGRAESDPRSVRVRAGDDAIPAADAREHTSPAPPPSAPRPLHAGHGGQDGGDIPAAERGAGTAEAGEEGGDGGSQGSQDTQLDLQGAAAARPAAAAAGGPRPRPILIQISDPDL